MSHDHTQSPGLSDHYTVSARTPSPRLYRSDDANTDAGRIARLEAEVAVLSDQRDELLKAFDSLKQSHEILRKFAVALMGDSLKGYVDGPDVR